MSDPKVTGAGPRRTICVVGPTLPFRGGIAQYNSQLIRAMRAEGHDCTAYSFSRQYPSWLYPGKSDRDEALGDFREEATEYSIDSVNPLTWIATARRISKHKPDYVVFHWWTIYWTPCFLLMMGYLQRRNIRVVLICHNLVDHETTWLKRVLSKRVIDKANAYLAHSTEHANWLQERYPEKQVAQHAIPLYGQFPVPKGMLPRSRGLELLFFGFIRPYKGLDVLLDALRIATRRDVRLTVVGETWGNADDITSQAEDSPNEIELHLGYMDDADVAEYFDRADFVVLPYRSATGSAVASVAWQYDKPIIATAVGSLADVVTDGLTGILVPPGDSAALADAIDRVSRVMANMMSREVRERKASLTWSALCDRLDQAAMEPKPDGMLR